MLAISDHGRFQESIYSGLAMADIYSNLVHQPAKWLSFGDFCAESIPILGFAINSYMILRDGRVLSGHSFIGIASNGIGRLANRQAGKHEQPVAEDIYDPSLFDEELDQI